MKLDLERGFNYIKNNKIEKLNDMFANKIMEKLLENKNGSLNNMDIELSKKLGKVSYFTIDRFENNFAVCENRETSEFVNISKDDIPKEAIVGDILKYTEGKFKIDKEQSKLVSKRIKNKMDNLWQ